MTRQSTSRHQASTRAAFARIAAIAMMGTASRGPKTSTNAGISMIEVPNPTTPPTVPANRPSISTKARLMAQPMLLAVDGQ